MARIYAMQVMFQWDFVKQDTAQLLAAFIEEHDMRKTEVKYFKKLVVNTIDAVKDIDAIMQPYLDRDLEELSQVELAVLRVAVYELKYRPEVPYKVVINEAMEVAKEYGAEDGHKFVNAVLDKLALNLREVETAHKQ